MSQDEDLSLLGDCLSGRSGAWEAFHDRFSAYLRRVCARVSGQETEDLLQEVFLILLEDDFKVLRSYRAESGARLSTYLAAIVVYRGRRRRRRVPEALLEKASPDSGPFERAQMREAQERIRAEMARLPSHAALALALRSDGASLREVGLALGISEGAATQLLHRARERIRLRLGEDGVSGKRA